MPKEKNINTRLMILECDKVIMKLLSEHVFLLKAQAFANLKLLYYHCRAIEGIHVMLREAEK